MTRASYDSGFYNYGINVSNYLTKNALKDENFNSDEQGMYLWCCKEIQKTKVL